LNYADRITSSKVRLRSSLRPYQYLPFLSYHDDIFVIQNMFQDGAEGESPLNEKPESDYLRARICLTFGNEEEQIVGRMWCWLGVISGIALWASLMSGVGHGYRHLYFKLVVLDEGLRDVQICGRSRAVREHDERLSANRVSRRPR